MLRNLEASVAQRVIPHTSGRKRSVLRRNFHSHNPAPFHHIAFVRVLSPVFWFNSSASLSGSLCHTMSFLIPSNPHPFYHCTHPSNFSILLNSTCSSNLNIAPTPPLMLLVHTTIYDSPIVFFLVLPRQYMAALQLLSYKRDFFFPLSYHNSPSHIQDSWKTKDVHFPPSIFLL